MSSIEADVPAETITGSRAGESHCGMIRTHGGERADSRRKMRFFIVRLTSIIIELTAARHARLFNQPIYIITRDHLRGSLACRAATSPLSFLQGVAE